MIELTTDQRRDLGRLWFIYGNGGAKHTHGNHRFIQTILEHGEDSRKFFRKPSRIPEFKPLTKECEQEVDKVIRQVVELNGSGDLAMSHKGDIGKKFYVVKKTKSGLIQLQAVDDSKHLITVPLKNIT